MPKQSSASKGTKKKVEAKRAAKAAAQSGSNPQAQPGDASNQHGRGKGTKKNKKSEPRKKQYIPPAKPPPKATDPVDDLGLASVMDAQLVVILRKFMKKDDKTLSRALDELLIWLNHPETDQLSKVMMLPVWTHHFPKLALQSGKRLRHATANVLSSLLSTSSEVRESLISGDDTAFFASWVMLAFDIDRSVKHVAFQTWSSAVDVAQPAHIDLSKQGAEMAHYLLGYIESGSSDVSEDAPKPIPQAMQSSSDIHLAEDTQSRQTRELVGSLGSLAWLVSHHPLPYASVEDLLHCSAWSLLRSHSTALPPTRKSAWTLLSAMLSQGIDFEPDQMGEISQALFAAFEDSDAGVQSVLWNGLLLLLQKHPDIWKTAEEHHNEVHDNDVEEEEVSIPVIVSTFFEFIAKRCPIQPAQNYPGLILLLASIPTSLYSTIDNDEPLFEALWTPTRLTQPYFDAALECMLFICKRATNEKARCIANAQVRQAISKAISSVEVEQLEFTTLVSALHKLHSYSPNLFKSAWSAVTDNVQSSLAEQRYVPLARTLCKISEVAKDDPLVHPESTSEICYVCQTLCEDLSATSDHDLLSDILAALDAIWNGCRMQLDQAALSAFDDAAQNVIPRLVLEIPQMSGPSVNFLESYVIGRNETRLSSIAWTSVLHLLPAADRKVARDLLERFVKLAQDGSLPHGLQSAKLDHMVREDMNQKVLSHAAAAIPASEISLLSSVLYQQTPFVEETLPQEIINLVLYQLIDHVDVAISSKSHSSNSSFSQMALVADFAARPHGLGKLQDMQLLEKAMTIAFKGCFLLQDHLLQPAKSIWSHFSACSLPVQQSIASKLTQECRKLLLNSDSRVSPAELCDAFRALQPHCQLADLLPDSEELSTLRRVCLSHSIPSASFAVFTYSFDPSHIPASTSDAAHQSSQPYLRAIAAACHCLVQDRSLTQSRSYLLSDFILVSHLIKSVLTEAPEPQTLEVRDLQALLQVCEASITLEISRVLPEVKTQWHSSAITSLQDSHEPGDLVATSLQTILEWAKAGPALPGSHCKQAIASTIRSIIQHRSDSPSQSAETWLSFIRRQSSTDVDFAASLLEACGPFLLDLPQFQRMQLQLASDLSGVKAADANTKGEALLRQLLASSPPYDSATELLPKQRAIFVIKALQQWLLDDSVEDLNDTVLGHLMGLLSHLAPTLQDVEGSHWDFSFDIAETVFDGADWKVSQTFLAVKQTCQWMEVMSPLISRNARLRQASKSRFEQLQRQALDFVLQAGNRPHQSGAAIIIIESMARSLTDYMPPQDGSHLYIPKLIDLMGDENHTLRMLAYQLALKIGQIEVQRLVVELELASEDLPQAGLPSELIASLSHVSDQGMGPFLLRWQLAMSLVDSASAAVRASFVDQLLKEDLVTGVLLPTLLNHLNFTSRTALFDFHTWYIEDPELNGIEPTALGTTLHSAHIFYRVLELLPSLARTWLESTKDRQLSSAFTAFVSKFFSPILIAKELQPLRDQQGAPRKPDPLDEDPLSIKVASGVSEVKASYNIDDQALELTVRLPPDYPLSPVEVRDSKRVGVSENTWRAWMMAVQQTVSSGNARIADSLELFKRNVTLHFEGVEACAICYSVISLADRRLPTKKCRTCKNIFHASCLFKWFSTSHGSSCPLCRSLF